MLTRRGFFRRALASVAVAAAAHYMPVPAPEKAKAYGKAPDQDALEQIQRLNQEMVNIMFYGQSNMQSFVGLAPRYTKQ